MPSAPLRFCTFPGCPEKVPSGRCAQHTPPSQHGWANRAGTNQQRIRGRKLQRLRTDLLVRSPFCPCGRLATVRDHIVPLAEGGADDVSNEQALCEDCHAKKTQAEAQRGRG